MGSQNMTLGEISEAADLVKQVVHDGANVIFGADVRDTLNDEIIVTIIATGFRNDPTKAATATEVPTNNDFREKIKENEKLDIFARPQQPQPQPQMQIPPMQQSQPIPPVMPQQPQPMPQPQPQPMPTQQQRTNIPGGRIKVDNGDYPEFLRRMREKKQ